jgi:hypothetical protein
VRQSLDVKDIDQSLLLLLLLGLVEDHALGGEHQAGHAAGVNQGCPDHLGGVHNPALLQVHVGSVCRVESALDVALLQQLGSNQVALEASVLADRNSRNSDGVLDDPDSSNLALSQARSLGQAVQALGSVEQRSTSSGDDAFSQGGPGGAEGVSDPVLDLSHLHLAAAAHLDHSDSSLQLGQPLLQLLLVVAALGDLDLLLDDVGPVLDVRPG